MSPEGVVAGELYRLHDPESHARKARFAYEGEEFVRVVARAICRGNEVETWIYRFCGDPPENARIQSGNFCAL